MAPKSPAKPASGSKQAASPKQKTPAKKAKTEEEEVPVAGEGDEAEEAEVGEEELAGAEEGADLPAGEGVAARTRAKEGGNSPAVGKGMAASAAANLLPAATITDILLGDHRDTVALLKHFEEVSGTGDKLMMEKLVDAICITIRLHSQAEFEVLYPMMEKRLGKKGKEAREHSVGEHVKIEEDLLKALEMRKSGSEELTSTIKEVLDLFVKHLHEEEDELVPMMLEKMSEEEQVEVAQQFMDAKARAPLTPQTQA